ncbi:DUF4169 family protein [Parvularcula dongshanensis]|uniref:DUF4169 domain-containing protein n=1 Tax=Parvularcula dongshanensis TaxID=1173995 RepID=A0A840I176_9PROT|nr:DUF4169 family protein [Parvularcula dongshanensis]MBB4657948.1 hypothetical protein [Parvularcula dongshanensis]
MAGEVVNLRLARKRKARAAKEADAAVNRASHGRTKAEKAASKRERETADRLLDGHAIGRPDEA